MRSARFKTLLRSSRLPFLILTPVSIFLGYATAQATDSEPNLIHLLLALIGGLAAHISVNALNEYQDFKSGLDSLTTRTPFSGGSGALISDPAGRFPVLLLGISGSLIAFLIGVYFALVQGWQIIPLGIVGLTLIVTYTRWLNRLPLLCLIAPGLGFGPLMVLGTHFALVGSFSLLSLVVSFVPFLLANNLLLLNQFPDIEPDRQVGRNHFPIAFGIRRSLRLYGVFALSVLAVLVFGVLSRLLPEISFVALVPMLAAAAAWAGMRLHSDEYADSIAVERCVPFLGLNVVASLSTTALLAISVAWGL